jgi:hypothetical protein
MVTMFAGAAVRAFQFAGAADIIAFYLKMNPASRV